MTKRFSKKTIVLTSIVMTLFLFAFSGSHPTTGSGGYTGAPNDSVCTVCHTPGSPLDGNIIVTGLPNPVLANTTYPLTVTINNTVGSAVRAGFQMVSLKTNLANGGTFGVAAGENNAQVKTAGGKSYVGHQPAKNFAANQVIYNVEWTSPASATGDITIYAASMIANGASGNSGDKFVASTVITSMGGGAPLSATFSNIVDASCFDSNDGSATINASGGSGNYSYEWDNGESSAIAVMLTGGDHMVTVTDDSSSEIIETVTIGAPADLQLSILSQTDAQCNGTSTGTAELAVSGGTPGYFFDWGNGITGSEQNNLAAGNYNVTLTDINGCTENITVFINEPPAITINIITLDQPSCNGGDDGIITALAAGGNGGFTYNWLDGIGIPNGGTLSAIPAGSYQLEVIDQQACVSMATITLGEPEAVGANLTGTDVLCFGEATGNATASGTGGSGSFSYTWSNGGSGNSQSDLIAATYFVTVSDSENCSLVSSIEIFEPSSPVEAGISISNQPNCGNTDGELSAFGLGGSPGYTYLWNDGTTSAVLTNLSSGVYTVIVTDDNGCSSSAAVTLQDNDGVSLAANDVINNTCNGNSEGAATISASGGSGVYTFAWSNGGSNATETGLPAGMYTISVTDDSNCSGEIMIEITEPDPFVGNETITSVNCSGGNDGTISLSAEGGTGALSYLWNIGSTGTSIGDLITGPYSVTITDQNACTGVLEFFVEEPDAISSSNLMITVPSCPEDTNGMISFDVTGGTGSLTFNWSTGDTTMSIENLGAGDYEVIITDENSCTSSLSFTLDDPLPILIEENLISPLCNDGMDGSITINNTGGTGDYSILWNTGDTTDIIENLVGGNYSVTVSDSNLCSSISEFELIDPDPIVPNISVTNVTVNGADDGTATADPQNGLPPYNYIWSTGDTTQTIENLAPDSYNVTITDANGCLVIGTAIVSNGDCSISSNVTISNISCFGFDDGSITVDLMGAVDPIDFNWSNEATTSEVTDLPPGTYNVTITDANNCQIQLIDIEITEPDDITESDAIISDASTSDAMDGSIEVDYSGGTGTLNVIFTDIDGNEIDNLNNLAPGSYNAQVTDENGCIKLFGPYEVGVISATEDLDVINANIYPNPARAYVRIDVDQVLLELPMLYSVSGQKIMTSQMANSSSYFINTDNLTDGVYYLKLTSKSDIQIKKVIIHK